MNTQPRNIKSVNATEKSLYAALTINRVKAISLHTENTGMAKACLAYSVAVPSTISVGTSTGVR